MVNLHTDAIRDEVRVTFRCLAITVWGLPAQPFTRVHYRIGCCYASEDVTLFS